MEKMQGISEERSSLAQSAVVSLVTLAALVLAGFVLAYWTWLWLSPRPEPRAEALAAPGNHVAFANDLFGKMQDRKIAATGLAIKLLGIVAASGGGRGYAVMQLDARQNVAVGEDQDIAPGVRLAEVHADHIVLERQGVRETLAWPTKSPTSNTTKQSKT